MIHPASQAQIEAADPRHSTWLSANAGSGKTRVLTGRVAWLMLEGVAPERILCLTYTKAAASEMQNRLFTQLGQWTMLPEAELRAELIKLGVASTSMTFDRLEHARTLFARAIEAPGRLKIQTIHAFCASLLRRFPLEAGVSPLFHELDERRLKLMMEETLNKMADGPEQALVDQVFAHLGSDQAVMSFLADLLKDRRYFETPKSRQEIFAAFDLPVDCTIKTLSEDILRDSGPTLNVLIPLLDPHHRQHGPVRKRLEAIDFSALGHAELASLESVFLFGAKTKTPFTSKAEKYPPAQLRDTLGPDHCQRLDALMDRIEQARDTRQRLAAAEQTADLYAFATPFLHHIEAEKTARSALDFDDMITKTRHLLTRADVTAWVLYKLDGGIDHILVDEAQDTSPDQWEVINALTQDFATGRETQDTARRVFVVGDKKQSIYSFQGADPSQFDKQRQSFETRFSVVKAPFTTHELTYSFRSAPLILRLVDTVFALDNTPDGDMRVNHKAFFTLKPGRITLWDPIPATPKAKEDRHWFDPVDQPASNHHHVLMAERVAEQLKAILDGTTPIEVGGTKRAVGPGDILILVQRRKALFHQIIAACKKAQLPIAGADVLKIGAEIAVKDLTALLKFLALPEDDLSLAEALRAPFFGFSEDDLFHLAHNRPHPRLWDSLQAQREKHPHTLAILHDLRGQVDYLRPYELMDRMLTRHDGRRKLLARLGAEAEEGIDALLFQALSYEANETPSLDGFIVWLETDEVKIKRQQEAGSGLIRVMTVHGAKGLEAPIVLLPETESLRLNDRATLLPGPQGVRAWRPRSDDMPDLLRMEADAGRTKLRAERDRLLYVALTRAESWLIIGAAGDIGKSPQDSWYGLIKAAVERFETSQTHLGQEVLEGDWHPLLRQDPPPSTPQEYEPDWTRTIVHTPKPKPLTLSPSELGGAKTLPGEGNLETAAALERGILIHMLLEHLADVTAEYRADKAHAILKEANAATELIPEVCEEALNILSATHFSWLFGPESLAEVPFTAPPLTAGGLLISGIIDRLVITAEDIWVVDYKSNTHIPQTPQEVPLGLLRQLGAYHHAITCLYPNHTVRTGILWTKTAQFMEVPQDIVIASL